MRNWIRVIGSVVVDHHMMTGECAKGERLNEFARAPGHRNPYVAAGLLEAA
jgi:hypothetical protein